MVRNNYTILPFDNGDTTIIFLVDIINIDLNAVLVEFIAFKIPNQPIDRREGRFFHQLGQGE